MHRLKVCFKCNQEKPLSEFYKHKMMSDGHLNKCKECAKKDAMKHRSENIEKIRAYDRERAKNPERAKDASAISSKWRKSDKRLSHAHNAVARAIRKGSLVRMPCERCGSKDSLAHHEDYNNPLGVTWLCQPCHKQRHKEMVNLGIDPF